MDLWNDVFNCNTLIILFCYYNYVYNDNNINKTYNILMHVFNNVFELAIHIILKITSLI